MASEELRLEAELRRLAFRDYLTGLPNMPAMAERISAAIDRARREGLTAALLILDMDGFRQVNDSLGNLGGDELLALIGSRLRTSAGGEFSVGRRGGDDY